MSRRWWALARVGGGLLVLGLLGWRLGTEPFVAGVRAVGPGSVAVTFAIVAGTTMCSAQRWRLVARGLGVELGAKEAVASYYRSQFLNSVLPGGVLGDVHRALTHRTLRSVVTERVVGQAIQVVVALLVVLIAWPTSTTPGTPTLAALAVTAVVGVAVLVVVLVDRDLLDAENVPAVLALSALAAAGHAAVFVVAGRAVGVTAPTPSLVALGLAVLVAAALPFNVAGWGPREGAAAWLFTAAGLGAATGTSVAVAYGVLAALATLPGAALLAVPRGRESHDRAPAPEAVTARG